MADDFGLLDDLTEVGLDLAKEPILTPSEIEVITQACKGDVLTVRVRPVLSATVAEFGEHALRELDLTISFDMADPEVADFLRTSSSGRIKDLFNRTTRNKLRETMAAGVEKGETMAQIQRRITDVFDKAIGHRSHNIARTETHRASNFGTYQGYIDAGVDKVQWVATRGAKNRHSHAPGMGLDLQIRKLNEAFVVVAGPNAGATALYPGGFGIAGEDCQCLCRVIAYFGQKILSEAQLKGLWKSFVDREEPFVRLYRRALVKGFREQKAAVLEALRRVEEKKS